MYQPKCKPDRYRQLITRQPAIGIAALVRRANSNPRLRQGPVAALRHVRQAGNLGTMIRSLDALCGREDPGSLSQDQNLAAAE